MNDTLCRTMRRSAPARLTPARNASLIAQRKPKSKNATKIESSVRIVRSFFRFRLLQTRPRNFMAGYREIPRESRGRLGGKLALVQVHGARGLGRGVGVMRDHHDRLAMFAIQR